MGGATRYGRPVAATDKLLAEQIDYYRAIAPEYEKHGLDQPGQPELRAALTAFRPRGHILELACGPGIWTADLAGYATTLTAVDASPEMLERARARVGDKPVRFIQANLFEWTPERRYDVVFFGFWLSHVPIDRFESFWATVRSALEPNGRVFFMDDNHRAAEELIEGAASSTVQRRLLDGTPYKAVKVPHEPNALERALRQLGWDIEVTGTTGPFYWGAGQLAR